VENGNEPVEIITGPATLEQLDVAVAELTAAEEAEEAARETLRLADLAWRKARAESARKRRNRNRVMQQLRHLGVTVLAGRTGMRHPQASRILADDQ
jgi:hypothetical protein